MIKLRRMRWAGHVAHMVDMKNAYKILVGKPEGKRQSEDTGIYGRIILMDLRETGLDDVDWIHMAQDRDRWRALVNTVMNLWVP
jgi:CRISPR/Cas system-associated protein Cas7 (RAMP superfamily)